MALIIIPLATLAGLLLFAVLAIAASVLIFRVLKNFLVNSVLGVAALLAINFLGASGGFALELSIANVVVAGVLGLAGVGMLVILKILGISF